MKLESQVCSIELAKRLKGIRPEARELILSLGCGYRRGWIDVVDDIQKKPRKGERVRQLSTPDRDRSPVSAFTVAELGDMLPTHVKTWRWKDGDKDREYWNRETETLHAKEGGLTEAEARARMLIYLIQNSLLEAGDFPLKQPASTK
jgi:hypothetical protein